MFSLSFDTFSKLPVFSLIGNTFGPFFLFSLCTGDPVWDSRRPCCYAVGLISAILCGDKDPTDNTDKARDKGVGNN